MAKVITNDNAVMESFFKTLKTELVYGERYKIRDESKKSIFEYNVNRTSQNI